MNGDDYLMASGAANGSINGPLGELKARFQTRLSALRERVLKTCDKVSDLKSDVELPQPSSSGAEAEAASILARGKMVLELSEKKIKSAVKALNAFKIRHGLLRNPINAKPIQKVMEFGVMLFIEGAVGAVFYMQSAMAAGPASAVLIAMMFSFVLILNAGTAGFLIGRWLNYGIHARDSDKFLPIRIGAWIGLIGFVGVQGFVLLSQALVRSQREIEWIEISLSSIGALAHQPEAIMLVISGAAFSAISFVKTMSAFSDPYPGFSELGQAVIEAVDENNAEHEEITEQTLDLFDNAVSDIEDRQKDYVDGIKAHNKAIPACRAAMRQFVKAVQSAELELQAEAAQEIALFQVAGGTLDDGFDLDRFCSFAHLLHDISIPEPLPLPDIDIDSSVLHDAKARALDQLADLFGEQPPSKPDTQSTRTNTNGDTL